MLDRRSSLHEKLCEILNNRNAYFQPPASLIRDYPAIRYKIARPDIRHANNTIYKSMDCYEIIVIDYDSESEIANKILKLPYCSFDRSYSSDNLNHFAFTLYY